MNNTDIADLRVYPSCTTLKWKSLMDRSVFPSCSSLGHPDGISVKDYYKDASNSPMYKYFDYISKEENQFTKEQSECAFDLSGTAESEYGLPDDPNKARQVTEVRKVASDCLNNELAPSKVTKYSTMGILDPSNKKCPEGDGVSCYATCDYGQPCKKFNTLFQKEDDEKAPFFATFDYCDSKLEDKGVKVNNKMMDVFKGMATNDRWISSAAATFNCQPDADTERNKPCIFTNPLTKQQRGVAMSPSAYMNNWTMALAVGGTDLAGNMPACYNNIDSENKPMFNSENMGDIINCSCSCDTNETLDILLPDEFNSQFSFGLPANEEISPETIKEINEDLIMLNMF